MEIRHTKIPSDMLQDRSIFLGYRGSVAHGVHVPSYDPDSIDDVDLIGVYVAPLEHYFGFQRKDTVERAMGEWDVVHYELRKFVNLLVKQNPNVLSTLWLKGDMALEVTSEWDRLVNSRNLFRSKESFNSFVGYARSQFKRMTRFVEFDPERQKLIDEINSEMMHRNSMARAHGPGNYAREPFKDWDAKKLRTEFNKLSGLQGYMGKKRKELVERFGYDTKNASHCVRILRMGIEFLYSGHMNVDRREHRVVSESGNLAGPDADALMAIKRGEFTLEAIKYEAEDLFARAEQALRQSPLPDTVDRDAAEELVVDILASHHFGRRPR